MTQTVRIRRPKAIVLDILGTASKSGFLEKILFPFLKVNLEAYINTHWLKREFIRLYVKIREQSVEFNKQEPNTPIVLPHESAEGKASLINFINFITENGINSPAVTSLRFKVWFEGYQQSKLRTPIYSDVPNKLKLWFSEGIKFYVFSNTWTEAQKALLRNTNHGDLTNLISGHFDNDFGVLTEPDSWRRLCTAINTSPNDVLFLTKSPLEGRAASDAGVAVVLVLTHRHNVKAVSKEDRQLFPYVRTLLDLEWLDASQMPSESTQVDTMPTQRTEMMMPSARAGSQAPTTATASSQASSSASKPASSSSRQVGASGVTSGTSPSSSTTKMTTGTEMPGASRVLSQRSSSSKK